MEQVYLFLGKCTFWLAVWAFIGYFCLAVYYVLLKHYEHSDLEDRFEWTSNAFEAVFRYSDHVFGDGVNGGPISYWLFPGIFGPIVFIALMLVLGELLLVHPFRARRLARADSQQTANKNRA